MSVHDVRGPEFDCVAAVCLDPAGGRGLDVPEGLDWALLRRISARHRVDGLIWQWLQAADAPTVPVATLHDLGQALHRQTFSYLAQLAETLRLTRLLDGRGIPSIVLKGCPLAQALYAPTPHLRHSVDIDLLVRPVDFAAVCAVLAAEGYQRQTPDEGIPASAESMARYLSSAFEFVHPVKDVKVELHHRPLSDPQVMAIPFETLLERSRWVEIGNGRVRCLGNEDLFVYLCCHAAGHVFFRMKWLADIARAVVVAPADAMAVQGATATHARAANAERHVRLTLHMLDVLTRGRIADRSPVPGDEAPIAGLARSALRAVTRLEDVQSQFRFADVADNLRDLAYEWRLSPSPRSRAYRLLTRLCNHQDLLTLRRGVEWCLLYALLGRPLALLRYMRRTRIGGTTGGHGGGAA